MDSNFNKQNIPAVYELRRLCQHTAPNPAKETHVGRFTRIFSIYTTWLFLHTPITPNQITSLGVAVYMAGLLVLFSDNYYVMLLGPVFYFMSIIIDGSDGEVARFRGLKGRFGGAYVEPVSHDNMYAYTFLLIGLAVYLKTGSDLILMFATAAAVFKLLYRLMQTRFWNAEYLGTEMVNKDVQNERAAVQHPAKRAFDFANRSLFSYTGIFIPFTLGVVCERLDIFIYFYGVSHVVLYLLMLFKHSRHISAYTQSVQ